MKRRRIVQILIIILQYFSYTSQRKHTKLPECKLNYTLETFPEYFIFGAGSSAYQIEGGWNLDGAGQSIWDTATHGIHKNKIADRSNADVTIDSYHKYMDDIDALKQSGFQSYRMSFSWSRLFPSGEASSLNYDAVTYYHKVIDALVANRIKPLVTLYHWDMPQSLQDFGGLLNPYFADYFEDYADIIFYEFGKKVKDWATFNEPDNICNFGYGQAVMAPFLNTSSNGGEYYCAYHLLLAHARVYRLYERKYKSTQGGSVGIILSFEYFYAQSKLGRDYEAAERGMLYNIGLYANPIFSKDGGFPSSVVREVHDESLKEGRMWSRLPRMDDTSQSFIQGSADWLGLNYYTSYLVKNDPYSDMKTGLMRDQKIITTKDDDWADTSYFFSVPEGFRDALNFIAKNYENPEIWITENGWADNGGKNDTARVLYFREHLKALQQAINCDNIPVKRYYAWSMFDNFEWIHGYKQKFGLYHVDFYNTERTRTPKESAKFWKEVNKLNRIPNN